MCDTLARRFDQGSIFAKNSDRSPNEAQVLEYHPARQGLRGDVKCTYISVPEAAQTNAVLLSRPEWMWGAEMGVNEHGLCIGNEAVFTRGAYGKSGLTGMDLLRLALERCATADEAAALIIELLERYGQGGNCGFDHDFYYDNAFLLMDRRKLLVLETAGKDWAIRESSSAAISNRLSLGTDTDRASQGGNFRMKHTEPVYTAFSGSACRRGQTLAALPQAETEADFFAALRSHEPGLSNPFTRGSVKSVCMHYGGLVGDHSTASMVAVLTEGRCVVWNSGSSLPCVSFFKPWLFGTETVTPVGGPGNDGRYWREAENFRRRLLGKRIPHEFYAVRDEIEARWLKESAALADSDFPAFSAQCLREEAEFYGQWNPDKFESLPCAPGYLRRWEKKTKALR